MAYQVKTFGRPQICYTGGGGQSSGTQTSTTVTKQELSPEQQALLGAASPALIDFAKNPPKNWQGDRIVPLNETEKAAQQSILGAAAGPATQIGQQAASTGNFLSGANLYADSNPYLRSAIDTAIRPAVQTFGETIMPSIRSDAVSSGQFGSSRHGIADGIASRALLDSVSGTAATMSNANYQKGQDSMVQALQMAPLIQQMQFVPGQTMAGVGTQDRLMAQATLDAQIQKFMTDQMLPYLAAKDVAGVAMGLPGGSTVSTATGPAQTAPDNTMGNVIGLGSMGIGLASLFM